MSFARAAITRPDYVAFTVLDVTRLEEMRQCLGIVFKEMGYGRYLYKQGEMAEVGGFELYYDGCRDGMGFHVRISGDGCRILEEKVGFEWIGFFRMLRDRFQTRFSRIDVAVDDVGFNIKMSTVLDAYKNGELVRHGKAAKFIESCDGDGRIGACLYIGARSSESMLRIYEKGIESGGDVPWLRFEAEFKGRRAEAWVDLLLAEGWSAGVGCLRHLWEFKDPEHKTTDRTRRRAVQWWIDVIDHAKHEFKLSEVAEQSWRKVKTWVVKQWAPMIHTMIEASGGDIGWLLELKDIGERRVSERHKRLMRLAGGMNGLSFA